MWTWNFEFVRYRLAHSVNIVYRAKVIRGVTVDRLTMTSKARSPQKDDLPDNQKIGGGGFVTEKWSSNQVIMQNLGHRAAIDVAKKKRFRVSNIEYRGLTDIELSHVVRKVSLVHLTFGTCSSLSSFFL